MCQDSVLGFWWPQSQKARGGHNFSNIRRFYSKKLYLDRKYLLCGYSGSLWYKIGVLRMGIMYLKSSALLSVKLCAYRYDLGLSNELLFIITAQGAAKFWPVKVGGLKKDLTQVVSSLFLLSKKLMHKAIFLEFQLWQVTQALKLWWWRVGSSLESHKSYLS